VVGTVTVPAEVVAVPKSNALPLVMVMGWMSLPETLTLADAVLSAAMAEPAIAESAAVAISMLRKVFI
jgi:hypothetical protein